MITKNTVSIVQVNSELDAIYINNRDKAIDYTNYNNLVSEHGNYNISHRNVYAELKDKDTNIVSIILSQEGEIESVYLNNIEKCESDYSILAKDSDKEYGTYKLIHTNKIEGEV